VWLPLVHSIQQLAKALVQRVLPGPVEQQQEVALVPKKLLPWQQKIVLPKPPSGPECCLQEWECPPLVRVQEVRV